MIRILPELFRKIYIKEYYDIEIACTYLTPSFILVEKDKGKNISWIHGPLDYFDYKTKKNIVKKFISFYLNKRQSKAFKISDKIIVISNMVYDSVISIYPEYKDKIEKIYNGYDIQTIEERALEEKVDFNIPTIISVGRLDKNKNHKLLIEACYKLKERISEFQFIIIGEGEERIELERLIRELKLEKYVNLYGYKSNPYPYIKSANVFVMSSYSEGFPTVIAEAMILKTPVIMTKVSGSKELTKNGEYGVLVERDVEEICESILKILSQDNTNITDKAYENIKKYSLHKQSNEFEKIFEL